MPTLILLRHGQSEWNLADLFTGWHDVGLTTLGAQEAAAAGSDLAAAGILPDVVHTSLQSRAITTANLALGACERAWVPVRRHWRLNERHYGALQGLNKAETVQKHGAEQVKLWRRSYDMRPPALELDDPRHPSHDPRYAELAPELLPASECLADVLYRVLPYWYDAVVPDLRQGTVLVAAHGNSLRALVKHLLDIPDGEIVGLEIPTGRPWLFELDDAMQVTSEGYVTAGD